MAANNLISRVLKSIFYSRAMSRAGKVAKSSALMLFLAQEAFEKMQQKGVREGLSDSVERVKLLMRLIRAYASGAYRQVPAKSLATIVGVMVYFVSPIDLIPDFLPIIGVADDVALMIWLFNTLGEEIERYNVWEKQHRTIEI